MPDWVVPFVTALKNAQPPFYAAVALATGLVLFLPNDAVSVLGLIEIRAEYRMYIGISFLVSICLLVASIGTLIIVLMKKWRARSELRREFQKHLKEMIAEEKDFIRPYVIDGINTRVAMIADGVVSGLELKGIIYRASNFGIPGYPPKFNYNLQPVARRFLLDKPQILDD